MRCYNFLGLVLTVYMTVALPKTKMEKIGPNGPIRSQEIVGEDKSANQRLEKKDAKGIHEVMPIDKNGDQETELLKLIETPVNDDVGKAVPVPIPQKIISGAIPLAPQPGKNWGRKMNEEQWRQHQARLNPKAREGSKKVMHNRNTINDNRHDKKGMKIPRHVP